MDGEERYDWQEVENLAPKGYCEIQDLARRLVYHGPVEKVSVGQNDDLVTIELKWVAQMGLPGSPTFGEWTKAPDANKMIIFPNLIVPFLIEETPEKGKRVRFGYNLIYINAIEGVDPKTVKGLDLTPPAPSAAAAQPAPKSPPAAPKAPRKTAKRKR